MEGVSLTTGTSSLVTYPTPASAETSSTFTVTVNGMPVAVQRTNTVSYVHFSFTGVANVRVTLEQDVADFRLSPVSNDIPATASGRDISFSLSAPKKLMLWRVNQLVERLLILADPLEDDAPVVDGQRVVNVQAFSADNTGATFATEAIQTAIETVASRDGGTVYVPAGVYKIRQLNLRSNVNLYLAGGAVLQASPNADDNDSVLSALWLEDAQNVKIFGRGTIDGSGSSLRPQGVVSKMIWLRKNTSNISIAGIILRNSPQANIVVQLSSHVTIENVKVVVDPADYLNTDGIDFESSSDITVENMLIYNSDDAFGLGHGFNEPRTTERIAVRNSTLIPGGGIQIGWEISQDFVRDIVYENLDIINPTKAISIAPGYGATVERIHFRSIRIEDIRNPEEHLFYPGEGFLFQLKVMIPTWEPNWNGRLGKIREIYFQNVSATEFGVADSPFAGYSAENNVDGVVFDNLYVGGQLISDANSARLSTNQFVSNISFSASDATIVNVHAATPFIDRQASGPGQFIVTRTGDTSQPLTVSYGIRGTATNGHAYRSLGGTVTFPAGAAETIIPLQPLGEPTSELKTVLLSLENTITTDYLLGPNYQAMIAIR